jgi:adenylate cyclase
MKKCPTCHHQYTDEELKFCRFDGTPLVNTARSGSTATVVLPSTSRDLGTLQLHPSSSIAVLPFANMSADPENEYFCDGLAEELLNALAKFDDLKVAARTSAFSFKGKNANVSDIGRILKVDKVLMGGVRKSGNRARITVQLVNANDGYHVWSERYDRELKDIFEVQDEITRAVVDTLKVKLFGEQETAHLKTGNAEAYELYLKGLYEANRYTAEGWERASEYFDQAIEKQPDYAAALAAKAHCKQYLYYYSIVPPETVIDEWLEATNHALAIDETIPEAHLSLANYYFYYERDWDHAEREFRRAIRLNQNSVAAHQFYGLFLVSRQRFDEGVREARRALELDPLSLLVNLHLGWTNWVAGRLQDVLDQIERMIELEPNFFGSYWIPVAEHHGY